MKNRIKLFGVIAMVAIIGFSMAACDNGSTGGGGNVPEALQGNWLNNNEYDTLKYLVFDANGLGNLNSSSDTPTSFSNVRIWWIVASVSGNTLNLHHRDFGSKVDGSVDYSITGDQLTLSDNSSFNGTYTKQ